MPYPSFCRIRWLDFPQAKLLDLSVRDSRTSSNHSGLALCHRTAFCLSAFLIAPVRAMRKHLSPCMHGASSKGGMSETKTGVTRASLLLTDNNSWFRRITGCCLRMQGSKRTLYSSSKSCASLTCRLHPQETHWIGSSTIRHNSTAASLQQTEPAKLVLNSQDKKVPRFPNGFWRDTKNIKRQLERFAPELGVKEVQFNKKKITCTLTRLLVVWLVSRLAPTGWR